MKCRRAQDWISLELDGQLAPDRVPHLQDHLESCVDCHEYRHQLQLGQRLLKATSTGPSEGFEWRLQLRLNQALKRAAGEASYPMPAEAVAPWRRWWGQFGLAGAIGLAAVLAVAILVQPLPGPATSGRQAAITDTDGLGARVPIATAQIDAGDGSRRPFTRRQPAGLGLGTFNGSGARSVSLEGPSLSRVPSWQRGIESDLLRLQQLERENLSLKRRVSIAEDRARRLQAQLDSIGQAPVNQH